MKAHLAFELVFYGLVLAFASAFIHRLAPEIPAHFRPLGMIAGGAVFVCGVIGLMGIGSTFWALLLQIIVSGGLVVELVLTWRNFKSRHPAGLIFLGLMLLLSVQLVRVLAHPSSDEEDPFDPKPPA